MSKVFTKNVLKLYFDFLSRKTNYEELGAFFDISWSLNKINVLKLSIGSISNFECNIIFFY